MVNAKAEECFGFRREELLSQSVHILARLKILYCQQFPFCSRDFQIARILPRKTPCAIAKSRLQPGVFSHNGNFCCIVSFQSDRICKFSSASCAAACSAACLLCPLPRPLISSCSSTSASKTLAWSGPLSATMR